MGSIVRGAAAVIVGCAAIRGVAAGTTVTLHVPADYSTIQEAVDRIGAGVVEVAAGNYAGFGVRTTRNGSATLTIRGMPGAVVDGGIGVSESKNIVIDSFTVVSAGIGVGVSYSSNVVVQNVTVRSSGGDGIRAQISSVLVTGNVVESAGGAGIAMTSVSGGGSGSLVVSNNTVVAAAGDGIVLGDLGSDVFVAGNIVRSAGGRGIRTQGGWKISVLNNFIGSTGGAGVSVFEVGSTIAYRFVQPGEGCTVKQNRIADTGGSGIEIGRVTAAEVSDNRIERTHFDGVSVSAATPRLSGNTIIDAGAAGIRVLPPSPDYATDSRAADARTVGENAITRPAQAGILLDHVERIEVTGNEIGDPGSDGVALVGSSRGRIIGNTVTGAAGSGFRLERGATRNVLAKNTARNCKRGLWAKGLTRKNRIARSNHFGRRRVRR